MAEPFLSEIRMMSFNFPPKGWAFCNGQLLPINQNQALFSLLGTVYGGNGQTNFGLPNLQGAVPIHFGAVSTLARPPASPRIRSRKARRRSIPTSRSARPAEHHEHERPGGRLPRHFGKQHLRRATGSRHLLGPPGSHLHRRVAGAQQHDALPDAELLHRAPGHFPLTDLGEADGPTVCWRDTHVRGEFRAVGWMFCDGQTLPISENETSVPVDRHDLWR